MLRFDRWALTQLKPKHASQHGISFGTCCMLRQNLLHAYYSVVFHNFILLGKVQDFTAVFSPVYLLVFS